MTEIKSKSVKTQCQTLDSHTVFLVDEGREQLLLSGSAIQSTHSVSDRLRPAPLHCVGISKVLGSSLQLGCTLASSLFLDSLCHMVPSLILSP